MVLQLKLNWLAATFDLNSQLQAHPNNKIGITDHFYFPLNVGIPTRMQFLHVNIYFLTQPNLLEPSAIQSQMKSI